MAEPIDQADDDWLSRSNEARPNPGDPRYFLALISPEPLASQVTALKAEMQTRYRSSAALQSPPHITLQAPFQWPLSDFVTLHSILQAVAHTQAAISVELQGFGSSRWPACRHIS